MQIEDNTPNNGIRWNWNPQLGSHFNGVFESQVKVAKKTLKVTVGNAGLTDAKKMQTAKKGRIHDKLDTIRVLRNSHTRRAGSTPSISYMVGNLRGQLIPQATEDIAFSPRNRYRLIKNLVKVFWRG